MKKYFALMSFIMAAMFMSVLASPMTASAETPELKVKWFGYIQATAGLGDGLMDDAADDDDGLRFGADRIRIGYKVKFGKVFSKLQVDFNKGEKEKEAGIAGIVKDAEVGYKFDTAASVKTGIFKTPVGMDFNTSGTKLDITKRGMEKQLVLERSFGLMLSGRKIGGGFGYDIGVFNPTTRSHAVSGGTPGDQIAYAGRVMYDHNKMLHVEASYGKSEEAGGAGTEDYTVWDVAVRFKSGDLTLKGEYIDAKDFEGEKDIDATVWYLHAGYQIAPMYEAVIRHYQADDDDGDTDLGNTYVGVNIFLHPKKKYNSRIQLNYVFASGDEWDSNLYGTDGLKGYADNVFLAQYQVKF